MTTNKFHYFTLEEVYEYAEKLGYSREEVEIIEEKGHNYDTDTDYIFGYSVEFGKEDVEIWAWYFEDLTKTSIDYEHGIWED